MVYSMRGHGDTVTGLCLSPNGYYILSNGMDNTGKRVGCGGRVSVWVSE